MKTDNTKKIYKAKITSIQKVSVNSHFIELDCNIPVDVKAGQFISIYCDGLTLRRPFSVFSNNNGKIGIIFKERGKGTAYIKSLKINDVVDIIGPLGNGFNITDKKSLLIGAGIGSAPISFLKTKLNERNIENLFISGFLNKDEIPSNAEIDEVYTDDGSFGIKGSVLSNLEKIIFDYKPEIIYACGPKIVLENISELGIKHNITTQIAMEKVMACGIGVCRGCVIDIKKDERIVNATVCKDGPVFYGNEVVWNS